MTYGGERELTTLTQATVKINVNGGVLADTRDCGKRCPLITCSFPSLNRW